jgi:tRNA pseudouridine13 synthase
MKMDFPTALKPVIPSGQIRTRPDDFIVEEVLGFTPAGEGEHLWLWVEKTSNNTDWVARQLARAAGVRTADIGFAGQKDRHAVTRQWFSLPDTKKTADFSEGELTEGVNILQVTRHTKKLRRGSLQGNRFRITVRGLVADPEAVIAQVQWIKRQGVPNYFGEQRFGHDGTNIDRAAALFQGNYRPRGRSEKSILLSSARSWIFNQIVSKRVLAQNWNMALPGDVMQLEGSHSIFIPEALDESIIERVDEGDIHPTGAMWGRGSLMSSADVAALEQRVADECPVLSAGLEEAGLKQERRALRVAVNDIECTFSEEEAVVFSFSLTSGAYATSVLREIVNYTQQVHVKS